MLRHPLIAHANGDLGAPFWYDALKDLMKLRAALASKENSQRETRQSAQASAKLASSLPPEAEQCDLSATARTR